MYLGWSKSLRVEAQASKPEQFVVETSDFAYVGTQVAKANGNERSFFFSFNKSSLSWKSFLRNIGFGGMERDC